MSAEAKPAPLMGRREFIITGARFALIGAVGLPFVAYGSDNYQKAKQATAEALSRFPDLPPSPPSASVLEQAKKINALYVERRSISDQPIAINRSDNPNNGALIEALETDKKAKEQAKDREIKVFRGTPQFQSAMKEREEASVAQDKAIKQNTRNRADEQSRLEDAMGVNIFNKNAGLLGVLAWVGGGFAAIIPVMIRNRPSWPLKERLAQAPATEMQPTPEVPTATT